MKVPRSTTRILLLALCVLVASCIDGREEYWVDARGGGRAEATYTLPAQVAALQGGEKGIRNQIEAFFRRTPELHSTSCEVETTGDALRIKVRASFDSALELRSISSSEAMSDLPAAATHIAGKVNTDIKGRTLDFKRRIDAGRAVPGSAFLPSSQFRGHSLVYIMHLPAVAAESNATRVEDSGRTLVWEYPLAEALKGPVETRFTLDIPIPWGWVTGVALPIACLGVLAIARLRKPPNPSMVGTTAN